MNIIIKNKELKILLLNSKYMSSYIDHRHNIIDTELPYLREDRINLDKSLVYIVIYCDTQEVIASIEWNFSNPLYLKDLYSYINPAIYLEKFLVHKNFRGGKVFQYLLWFSTNSLMNIFSCKQKYNALSKDKLFIFYKKFGVQKCKDIYLKERQGKYTVFSGNLGLTNKILSKKLFTKGNNNEYRII